MGDNRRRVKQFVLQEIESHEGDNFTEKLLRWKQDTDSLSKSDVRDAVEEAIAALDRR